MQEIHLPHMHTSDFADIAKTKLRQKQAASAAPTTSTAQAIDSAPNNTRKPKEVSDGAYKFPGSGDAAYRVVLDSNGQKHGRSLGQNIDFTSSQASAWADEELVKQEPAMGDTPKPLFLDNSKNITEEEAMRAGKEHGAKICRVFDEAWANARDKS